MQAHVQQLKEAKFVHHTSSLSDTDRLCCNVWAMEAVGWYCIFKLEFTNMTLEALCQEVDIQYQGPILQP
jgi:hypothetical protein